jgi:molybdopterin/thiamine biosynthesis adenylyltransferase
MEDILADSDVRSRQAELVDDEILTNPITIVGCGAIGSFTALAIAKMGFHDITVYDNDKVSTENISNQFYRYKDIGFNKASALCHMIEDFENILIKPVTDKWIPSLSEYLTPYVIMAVDSMTVRTLLYKSILKNPDIKGFIDGRMGGQQAEIYTIGNNRYERGIYKNYLWKEEEASELRCTQKAVMYNVLWIASLIANNLRLMMENKPYKNTMIMDFENTEHQNITHK